MNFNLFLHYTGAVNRGKHKEAVIRFGSGMGMRALLESQRQGCGGLTKGKGANMCLGGRCMRAHTSSSHHIWCARTGGKGCGGVARDGAGTGLKNPALLVSTLCCFSQENILRT